MSKLALGQLAELVDGDLHGDPRHTIQDAATLDQAGPHDISFAENPKLAESAEKSHAGALVVGREFPLTNRPSIIVDNVRQAFDQIATHLRPPRKSNFVGIHPNAQISDSATIGKNVEIHSGAQIGDDVIIGNNSVIHANACLMPGCQIGEQVRIFPNATLYEDTIVGDRTVIHANAVIGAYGFGYDSDTGQHIRKAQLGNAIIGTDVEIGACSTIDRGAYGPTTIGDGTKIDNLVMIAHNCRIGKHNLICSQVGIAGSSSTGDYVVMAGQVGVPDHCSIGNRAVLGAKSGIMRDVPDDMTMLGIPATPEREQMLMLAAFQRLPEMRKHLRRLQKAVDELTQVRDERRSEAA